MHYGIIHPVYSLPTVSFQYQILASRSSMDSHRVTALQGSLSKTPQGRRINWTQHLHFSELLIEKALKEFDGTATWFTTLWAFLSAFHVFHPCRAASHLLLLLGLTSTRSLFRPLTRQDIHIWSATHFSQLLFFQHATRLDLMDFWELDVLSDQVKQFLSMSQPVLFIGESGTAKSAALLKSACRGLVTIVFQKAVPLLACTRYPSFSHLNFQVTMQNTLESYPSDASVILNINYSSRTSQSLWIHLDNMP